MKKYFVRLLGALTLAGMPLVAAAAASFAAPQQLNSRSTLSDLIYLIIGYLNLALLLLMAFAVVVFVIFVIRYFVIANDDHKQAGQYVMYSVIGFFVILSFWGLVNILQNTFGLRNENAQPASWSSIQSLFPR